MRAGLLTKGQQLRDRSLQKSKCCFGNNGMRSSVVSETSETLLLSGSLVGGILEKGSSIA
jgi:hypothetical protein